MFSFVYLRKISSFGPLLDHFGRVTSSLSSFLVLLIMSVLSTSLPSSSALLSQVQTLLQGVRLVEENEHLPVAIARQKSAFPPNFVHSLDSTHMLLTAMEMDKAGVPFAAVHDSYWVHAGNIDKMNAQLRQVNLTARSRSKKRRMQSTLPAKRDLCERYEFTMNGCGGVARM